MSFCSLKRSETISSQYRLDSSDQNTSQQIISHQMPTAVHNFNNRKENEQESQMYQEAYAQNDLLRTNGSQEVSSGRSNFQPPGNFQPSKNFQPPKNLQPSGNLQASSNFQPPGNFQPSKTFQPSKNFQASGNLQASSNFQPPGNFQPSGNFLSSGTAFSSTNLLSSSKLDAASSRPKLEEFNENLRVHNKEVSEKRIEAAVMSVEEALCIDTHWMEKMQRATDTMNACRGEIEGSNFVTESSKMEIRFY